MAASWLRISDLSKSFADSVCIVARVHSINRAQRTLIIYDDDDDENGTSSSVTLHVSCPNLRTPFDIQSPKRCVQIYGKVIRQAGDIIRVDAQLIRQLGVDFDINEYVKGLMLTRQYMAHINSSDVDNEGLADNSGNPIRTIL